MKYTTVKMSEIAAHPKKRLDPGYWIKKKKRSGRALPGAASIPKDCGKIMSEKEKKDKNFLANHIQIIHYGKIR